MRTGRDWLGILGTFSQGGAIYGMIDGLGNSKTATPPAKKVTVTPVSGRGYGGVSLSGTS